MQDKSLISIEAFIKGSEKILDRFGYWPSFHDAEIINFHLWRGHIDQARGLYLFPVLTLDLHHWGFSGQLDNKGYYVLQHHTRTTLTFRDVLEMHLDGFNEQNAISGLIIDRLEREQPPSPYFAVQIEGHTGGPDASFTCQSVEVTTAVPCTSDGEPL